MVACKQPLLNSIFNATRHCKYMRLRNAMKPHFQITGSGALVAATTLVAALIAVPIIAVLANLFAQGQGTWQHLAATVLPEYIANTLWLAAGVGAMVIFGGVASAWLVTMCRFPGRGIFEWALILPLAMPAYIMAYAYTDFLQFTGPVQAGLRALTGREAPEEWVS